MMISKRAFVSFDEFCPYQCKHCYTYGIKREKNRSVTEIVDGIADAEFDVIYVSQKNDNFSDPLKGIELCWQLFSKYKQNIFIITRNTLNDNELSALIKLRNKITEASKHLFVAISLNATNSIHISENVDKVRTPAERVDFIKKLSRHGFKPILMLRPIFPAKFIPVEECLQLIDELHSYVSCVVTSSLGINDDVLSRLNMKESDFTYCQNQEYLDGAISGEIKFVDVEYEIQRIRQRCNSMNVPVFLHSMPAINYVAES